MDRDEGSLRPRRLDDTAAFPQDLDLALEDSPRRSAARHTRHRGWMIFSSACHQGRHAAISRLFGFLWSRRLPLGSHLKCFTALVT